MAVNRSHGQELRVGQGENQIGMGMRTRTWLTWLLLVATGTATLAQAPGLLLRRHSVTRTIIFHTDPPGATVQLAGTMPLQTLGDSGQPITLMVPVDNNVQLHFMLSLRGYQTNFYQVAASELQQQGVYHLPSDGTSLLMVPDSPLIYVRDLAKRHQVASAALVGLIILGVFGYRARLRYLVKAARRSVTLSTLTSQATGSTLADPSLVGQKLGRWWLTDKLGKGGMAVVYRGVPEDSLDAAQAVAVKVINADGLESLESRARFEREVRIGAKLNHPNIVRLIDWETGGPFYLVMELVDGDPLRTRVRPEGMSPGEAMNLMLPIFDAMIYAHSQGVWHRDLKPENVFINSVDKITVMDFGISRQATDVTVTATDKMPVTPGYMSPEQFSGKNVAAASDQYTLGIMVWELLVGHRPFVDPSPMVVVMQHLGMPLPSIRESQPHLSEELDMVINRMCSKNPLERYPDLQSAVWALEEAVANA